MIKAIKAMQIDENKTGIKDDAIYQVSIGNYKSLKPQYSKGEYIEETSNARSQYYKNLMFPNFMRKREGYPTDFKTESLVFSDGIIKGLFYTYKDGSHEMKNI